MARTSTKRFTPASRSMASRASIGRLLWPIVNSMLGRPVDGRSDGDAELARSAAAVDRDLNQAARVLVPERRPWLRVREHACVRELVASDDEPVCLQHAVGADAGEAVAVVIDVDDL